MKPIVGINVDLKLGPPPEAALQIPYLEAIEKSGGIPVMIPPLNDEDLRRVLSRIDGLMFIGGADYSPKRYCEEPDESVKLIHERREGFDFLLLDEALKESRLPILGICLGCQLLNIGLGGSLLQDIPKHFPESKVPHASPNGWEVGFNNHDVVVQKDSKIYNIYKKDRFGVSTSHHQAINRVGKGLKIVAHSDDGVVEAIEYPERKFVIGVQWHPERDYEGNKPLFDEFIAACRNGNGNGNGQHN